MIKRRRSVDEVHSEQSQWVGPSSFTYKAEVDFDGTWLAAQLYARYEHVFLAAAVEGPNRVRQDLTWLLPAFAEDVTRILEKEVRDIQREVSEEVKEMAVSFVVHLFFCYFCSLGHVRLQRSSLY